MEIFSGDPKDNHPPEPEHQVETPQLRKSLIIYTSVDAASETLKTPIDVRISCSNYTLIHFRSRSDHIHAYPAHCQPRQVLACYRVEGTDNSFSSGYVLLSCFLSDSSL